MAVTTSIIAGSGGDSVLLTVTDDDVTDDIVQFDLVCTIPVHITVYRKSGSPWRNATVAPGSYTYEAGGPVRNWDDLSRIEIGW